MRSVYIGRLGRPHGLRGELYLDDVSLDAAELRTLGEFEWRGKSGARRTLVLAGTRDSVPRPLVTFHGVTSREAAAELVNGELWADAAKLPDPGPGVVYAFQLVGLRVVTPEGRELGPVRSVLQNGAQTLYVVGDRETLVPGHTPFLKRVDLEGGTITVELPPGFEELE